MLSAKIRIDNLVKSNKIVIFVRTRTQVNQQSNVQRNQIMDSIRETFRQKTEISTLYSDSSKNFFYKSISLNTESFIRNLLDSQQDTDLKFDICEFLDTYAIARKFVNVIDLDYLTNQKECESYLRNICDEEVLKYPLVFMHGVFFGSDEEILLGHSKGFLYELFCDTGLYNMAVIRNHFDYSEVKSNLDRTSEFGSSYDSDDEMIERVAMDNQIEAFINSSSLGTTSTVRDFINSRSSQPAAPQLMAELQSDSFLTSESCSDLVNLQDSVRNRLRGINFSLAEHVTATSCDSEQSDHTRRLEKRVKKFTPPADVLATINKWLKKTKQVIETRNKIIAFKNSIISIKLN